jgi:hypothetical protein
MQVLDGHISTFLNDALVLISACYYCCLYQLFIVQLFSVLFISVIQCSILLFSIHVMQ